MAILHTTKTLAPTALALLALTGGPTQRLTRPPLRTITRAPAPTAVAGGASGWRSVVKQSRDAWIGRCPQDAAASRATRRAASACTAGALDGRRRRRRVPRAGGGGSVGAQNPRAHLGHGRRPPRVGAGDRGGAAAVRALRGRDRRPADRPRPLADQSGGAELQDDGAVAVDVADVLPPHVAAAAPRRLEPRAARHVLRRVPEVHRGQRARPRRLDAPDDAGRAAQGATPPPRPPAASPTHFPLLPVRSSPTSTAAATARSRSPRW